MMKEIVEKEEAFRYLGQAFEKGIDAVLTDILKSPKGMGMLFSGVYHQQCEFHDSSKNAWRRAMGLDWSEAKLKELLIDYGYSPAGWNITEIRGIAAARLVKDIEEEKINSVLDVHYWYPQAANIVAQELKVTEQYRGFDLGEMVIRDLMGPKALKEIMELAVAACEEFSLEEELVKAKGIPRLNPRVERLLMEFFRTPNGQYLKVFDIVNDFCASDVFVSELEIRRYIAIIKIFGVKNKRRIGYFMSPEGRVLAEAYLRKYDLLRQPIDGA